MSQSLPEQLTVCGLLGLILTLSLHLASPCLRLWNREEVTRGQQQARLVVSARLERELRGTTREGLSHGSDWLAFPVASDQYDPNTGSPMYESYAIYFLRDSWLIRKSLPRPAGPMRALTAAEVAVAISPSPGETRVAGGIEGLELTDQVKPLQLLLEQPNQPPMCLAVEPRL